MTATSKRSGGPGAEPELVLLAILIFTVLVGLVVLAAGLRIAVAIDGTHQALPGDPLSLAVGLAKGTVGWPRSARTVLIALSGALALLAVLVALLVRRTRGHRSRVDRASRRMGRGHDLAALSRKGAAATAARLGVTAPGLPIARTIPGNRMLYAGWEDVSVDIWGPRAGKTTSRAIPAVLAAPGAVLVTSNKRDIVDATRDPRASSAGQVWVFDPQGIAGEAPAWWWNPLSYVTNEVRASILADVFASAGRDPHARTDAYFEPAAQHLLANLLLAAAAANRALTQVYLWLADPTEDEPVAILRDHRYPLLAAALQAVINAPEKQRGGVYGTAQQIASFLTNSQAMRWVTPTPGRPAFDVARFVAANDTMYSLSKEGRGSAGPLVTAMTVAVCEAAEDLAKHSPGGRLRVPLVAVLDEAANVCRWRELPNLYSHYGSRGICVMTILQSWSQGVEVWGRDGMRKLWSAANVKVYGGGVSEVEFLSELSQLVGDYDLHSTSRTYSPGRGGGRSTSHSVRRERILEVSDLAALPRGRVVVFASGTPGTLARPVAWMDGPHANQVAASIRQHDPGARATVTAPTWSL